LLATVKTLQLGQRPTYTAFKTIHSISSSYAFYAGVQVIQLGKPVKPFRNLLWKLGLRH